MKRDALQLIRMKLMPIKKQAVLSERLERISK